MIDVAIVALIAVLCVLVTRCRCGRCVKCKQRQIDRIHRDMERRQDLARRRGAVTSPLPGARHR